MSAYQSGRFRRHAVPALKSVGKFIIINAATYGPAGIAGWAVKSVARRPLRILLTLTLEPILARAMRHVSARFNKETNETTAK
ncbi:Phage shock protein D [Paramixta manurensis]|uniref:Phage shock protein D n=1 Tax=Paramixta manurensis TaxID=2740817 RepID=A0A6M8UE92_9GAMM|nr:Phage shock protein D [Erwiniaceae bacterium PD-1]